LEGDGFGLSVGLRYLWYLALGKAKEREKTDARDKNNTRSDYSNTVDQFPIPPKVANSKPEVE
jgi:hypothetical protein